MKRIALGMVEDQQLFMEGIKALLEYQNRFDFIVEAINGPAFIEQLHAAAILPDVVLVDLSLPDVDGKHFSGLDVTQYIHSEFPSIRIIILSAFTDHFHIAQLIAAGANAFLAKDTHPDELGEAIIDCVERGCYFNQKTMEAIQSGLTDKQKISDTFSQNVQLTGREQEVLKLICHQHTAREIGEILFISTKTVNGHRNNLLQKTGARNTAGLVVYALQNRLVNLDF